MQQQFGNMDSHNYFNTKHKITMSKKDLFDTFSPVIANGALNHCSKLAHDLKILGNKKFSNAHNSGNLFCHSQQHSINYTSHSVFV